jgi:CHAD domain-containing protein
MLSHLRLLAEALEPDERLAVRALLGKLELEREAAQAKLVETLESERYLTLLDRFEAALAALQPARGAPELGSLLQGELSRLRRSVKALGLDPRDAELHELRKRGKRARYTAELAGNERAAARAKQLQDILGEHQDAVVAQQRLRSLAAGATPLEAFAAGRLVEHEQQRKARARARWRKAWRGADRSA